MGITPAPLLPRVRRFARAYGHGAAYFLALYYSYLFALAYLSPFGMVRFWVNFYGEGDIEAVIMALTVPAIVYAAWSEARQYRITIEKRTEETTP